MAVGIVSYGQYNFMWANDLLVKNKFWMVRTASTDTFSISQNATTTEINSTNPIVLNNTFTITPLTNSKLIGTNASKQLISVEDIDITDTTITAITVDTLHINHELDLDYLSLGMTRDISATSSMLQIGKTTPVGLVGLTNYSNGLAHGITTILPTSAQFQIKTLNNSSGGAVINSISANTGVNPIIINGISTTALTTVGYITINAALKNGTGVQAIGVSENLFTVTNNTSERFKVTGEGNIYTRANAASSFGKESVQFAATAGSNFTIHAGACYPTGTNLNGGFLILNPGISTNQGLSQTTLRRLTRPSASGTTNNTYRDAIMVMSDKHLVNNTATTIFTVPFPTDSATYGNSVSGKILYEIAVRGSDGVQIHSGVCEYVGYEYLGDVVVNTPIDISSEKLYGASTLTVTPLLAYAAGVWTMKFTVNSSLTTPLIKFNYDLIQGNGGATVTQN